MKFFPKYIKFVNKPRNIPQYINAKSDHQPNIIKNLPECIFCRINKLSSDKSVSDNSIELYNNAPYSSRLRSNSIKILTRILVEVKTGKEKLYGSTRHIVAMFSPTMVKFFSQS